ncbi:MAG: hypothetical protein ACRBCI_14525 [Cellvibrionaceae bacterium]
MSVIPSSQLSLMRKRRQLKELMEAGQWDKVLELESDLFTEIDIAAQDPQRSPKELLSELGSVIRVYRELSGMCHMYGKDYQHPQR